MFHPAAPTSLEKLTKFNFERVVNEDPLTHIITILGTLPAPQSQGDAGERVRAIIRIERTAIAPDQAESLFSGENASLTRVALEESTDIYTWLFGWLGEKRERDVKINVICPATEVHVRKYTKQTLIMVRETPELYENIVKPYISAVPASRTQWVENILNGISEQSKVLYSSPEFLILPDMKWDLKNLASLYLVALIRDRTIQSLRDLRKKHVEMLCGSLPTELL